MEKGKLMVRAFLFVLVVLGLGSGAFYWSNPELAKKTVEENKAKVEKLVDDLKKKSE